MMDDKVLTNEDIGVIIKLIEESKFDFLQLEYGDFKLNISKKGNIFDQTIGEQPISSAAVKTPALIKEPETKEPPAPNLKVDEVTDQAAEEEVVVEEGLVPIKAPTVGIFYCAPEPGAKPFVSIGSKVDKNTAVGLIEVMKVYTRIMAGVKGVIKKRLVENAKLVEHGQTIFLVEPDEDNK